ncbi:hypothetical protein J7E93_19365 [Streptomyces sp. ISL-36]|nr:hypothetical protein [Streptomyces sp. ISL-36]
MSVEVATNLVTSRDFIPVRDSKRPNGRFAAGIKDGELGVA